MVSFLVTESSQPSNTMNPHFYLRYRYHSQLQTSLKECHEKESNTERFCKAIGNSFIFYFILTVTISFIVCQQEKGIEAELLYQKLRVILVNI